MVHQCGHRASGPAPPPTYTDGVEGCDVKVEELYVGPMVLTRSNSLREQHHSSTAHISRTAGQLCCNRVEGVPEGGRGGEGGLACRGKTCNAPMLEYTTT